MNILQSSKLGHKLTMIHKKSSAVFAVFFGLLFSSVVLLSNTIDNWYAHINESFTTATSGKYLAKISMCHGSYVDGNCEQPEIYDDVAKTVARKYHGDMIGAVITYVSEGKETIYVIPEKAARTLDAEPAYYAYDDTVPIVVSAGTSTKDNDFYELGSYPGDGVNKYFVLDGSDKLLNYLVENGYVVENYAPLLIFDTFEDLLNIEKTESDVHEIFTRQIEEKREYDKKIMTAKNLFICLLILSIVTMIIMLVILFLKDEKIVSLYRSLGATKKNIAAIYLVNVIEIAIYISLISLIVGNAISSLIIH